MKKIFAGFAALIIILISSGCKKIITKVFPGMDVNVPGIEVKLPPIPFTTTQEVTIGTYMQRFNFDSTVRATTNGSYTATDVKSVMVKNLTFVVKNADENNNLSNFESARFNFSSSADTNQVEIASLTFPNTYSDSTSFTPIQNRELIYYLQGNQLYYTVYGKVRKVTTKPMDLVVGVTLRVR